MYYERLVDSAIGLFFEDLAVRDLAAYAESRGGSVRHYRDNAGLECDAVVHMEDGRWAAARVGCCSANCNGT